MLVHCIRTLVLIRRHSPVKTADTTIVIRKSFVKETLKFRGQYLCDYTMSGLEAQAVSRTFFAVLVQPEKFYVRAG